MGGTAATAVRTHAIIKAILGVATKQRCTSQRCFMYNFNNDCTHYKHIQSMKQNACSWNEDECLQSADECVVQNLKHVGDGYCDDGHKVCIILFAIMIGRTIIFMGRE